MRFFKIPFFIILVLCLQTVFLPKLGLAPDLVLVSIIIFAVHYSYNRALVFTLFVSLAQDLFSSGGYYNLVFKALVCLLINLVKHNFEGEEHKLIFILVAILSPLSFVVEAFLVFPEFAIMTVVLRTVWLTILNLLSVFLLLPLVERFCDE